MTLDDFRALCEKEWNECRGEPVTLWLTEGSYRELRDYAAEGTVLHKEDGVTQAATRVIYDHRNVPAQVSMHSSTLVNPVTRNEVRMKLAKDRDAMDCFSVRDKIMYTKVLS